MELDALRRRMPLDMPQIPLNVHPQPIGLARTGGFVRLGDERQKSQCAAGRFIITTLRSTDKLARMLASDRPTRAGCRSVKVSRAFCLLRGQAVTVFKGELLV